MKVLMVVGSPHKEGCVYTALCEVASALNTEGIDTDFFWIGNKPAAAVVTARRAGTTVTWDQINKYFGLMQMPIITSRYWNMAFGANPEELKKDREGMQIMRILGKNMAWFLKCKQAGEKAGIALPEQEKIDFTNFIRDDL